MSFAQRANRAFNETSAYQFKLIDDIKNGRPLGTDHYLLLAGAGVGAGGALASAADLVTGPTNAINSGELPVNLAYGYAVPLVSAAGAVAGDAIAGAMEPSAADVKKDLKAYARKHGYEAAQKRFADAKNRVPGQGRNRARMAGALLGTMGGVTLGVNKIADTTPDLQVNPYYG